MLSKLLSSDCLLSNLNWLLSDMFRNWTRKKGKGRHQGTTIIKDASHLRETENTILLLVTSNFVSPNFMYSCAKISLWICQKTFELLIEEKDVKGEKCREDFHFIHIFLSRYDIINSEYSYNHLEYICDLWQIVFD